MPVSESGAEEQAHEVRKGRRELSTSKRAAQNRAAQVRCSIELLMVMPKLIPAHSAHFDSAKKHTFRHCRTKSRNTRP